MKHRFLVSAAAVAASSFLLTSGLAFGQTAKTGLSAPGAAKSWTAPKTPWGDPDLQGTWTSDDCIGTPLNRPANLGEKLYYTEEDLAQRQAQLARQQQNDLQDTVAPNARVGTGPPGHWGERARRPCKQTSLVVDPADGQTPTLVPEAQNRPT